MKYNDRVMVNNEKLVTHGQKGVIKYMWPFEKKCDVLLDSGRSISIKAQNLALIEDKKQPKESEMSILYILCMHDQSENPKSLAEAEDDNHFNLQEPTCASIDIEVIKDALVEEGVNWLNAYIVANNKIHPVNMTPACPGLF